MKNSLKNVVLSGILTVVIGAGAVGCSKSSEQVKADETLASASTSNEATDQTKLAKADSANLGAGSSGRAR